VKVVLKQIIQLIEEKKKKTVWIWLPAVNQISRCLNLVFLVVLVTYIACIYYSNKA